MCAGFSVVNASAKMPEIGERQHNRQLRIDPPLSRRSIFVGKTGRRCRPNVRGRTVRELYELNGKGEVDPRDSGRSRHIEGHCAQERTL